MRGRSGCRRRRRQRRSAQDTASPRRSGQPDDPCARKRASPSNRSCALRPAEKGAERPAQRRRYAAALRRSGQPDNPFRPAAGANIRRFARSRRKRPVPDATKPDLLSDSKSIPLYAMSLRLLKALFRAGYLSPDKAFFKAYHARMKKATSHLVFRYFNKNETVFRRLHFCYFNRNFSLALKN